MLKHVTLEKLQSLKLTGMLTASEEQMTMTECNRFSRCHPGSPRSQRPQNQSETRINEKKNERLDDNPDESYITQRPASLRSDGRFGSERGGAKVRNDLAPSLRTDCRNRRNRHGRGKRLGGRRIDPLQRPQQSVHRDVNRWDTSFRPSTACLVGTHTGTPRVYYPRVP
jgi:hypothetical protein